MRSSRIFFHITWREPLFGKDAEVFEYYVNQGGLVVSFRIQNNITSLIAHRSLALADSSMARSLERLSSGYRINRAADDAAGLSVATSLRADVAGAQVAQRNVSEGNAMLQVAEGALEQVGNILTRMKELATQAASANTGSNLAKINAEYGQLQSEIDRIVKSTQYGAKNLLDGTLAAGAGTPATPDGPSTAGPITNGPGIGYGVAANGRVEWNMNVLLQNDRVTACDPAVAAPGTWKLRQNGANVDLIDPSSTVRDTATPNGTNDLVFANVGVTITNVGGLPASAYDGSINNGFCMRSSGLTNLDVSGAAAGTYTATYSAGDTTVSDGIHSQTLTLLSGAQTIAFNNIGITFIVDANFQASDLGNMQFTVTASTPGDPGTPSGPG
ncbi:MAG: flagellin, partial [Syntrophales bacterium]|nr:flagellin [Syntrophales bacterium]